ncbi:MAG: cytochrome-c peroxidase, partial [Bacteroidota bacterium]
MKLIQILSLLSILTLVACQSDDDIFIDNDGIIDINDSNNNGHVNLNDLEELGRLLFWDPILSGGLDVSCATCHHPDFGYADGRSLPIGIGGRGLGPERVDVLDDGMGLVGRNSPTILNTAFNGMDEEGNYNPALAPMFWDNRAFSLEEQALLPLHSFEEMRGHAFDESVTLDSIVARLSANTQYQALFTAAYGQEDAITSDNIGHAIATFERSITATNSPFDRYQAGDENALTQQQIRGFNRFRNIGCDDCHSGPMFSDFELHVLAVPDHPMLTESDRGANGTYAFRTPT